MSVCVFVFQGQDYEIRTYHPTKWMSTSVSGMDLEAAMNTGFRRLFKYIQGENKGSEFKLSDSKMLLVVFFILLRFCQRSPSVCEAFNL